MQLTIETCYAIIDSDGVCRAAGTARPSLDPESKATIDVPAGWSILTDFADEPAALAFAQEHGFDPEIFG
jgi:hypothetical protein